MPGRRRWPSRPRPRRHPGRGRRAAAVPLRARSRPSSRYRPSVAPAVEPPDPRSTAAVAKAHHSGYSASGARRRALARATDRRVRSALLTVSAAAATADVPSSRRLKNSHDQLPLSTRFSASSAEYVRAARRSPRSSSVVDGARRHHRDVGVQHRPHDRERLARRLETGLAQLLVPSAIDGRAGWPGRRSRRWRRTPRRGLGEGRGTHTDSFRACSAAYPAGARVETATVR